MYHSPFTRKLGMFFADRRDSHSNLAASLKQAQIPLPIDMYLVRSIHYSLLISVIVMSFCLIYIPKYGLIAFIYSIPISILSGGTTYYLFNYYPKFKKDVAGSRINLLLPSAVTYMYALSRGGMELLEIFESLGRQRQVYGDVASHIGYIVRDIKYFNTDIMTSLHNASKRSPSMHMRDFFDGLITVISSGGSLTEYFKSRSDQYYELAGKEQEQYLRSVGILAEAYITVFVAGPVFLMTVLVVVGLINNISIIILKVLVYGVIPWSTGICLILLSNMAGIHEETYLVYTTARRLDVFNEAKIKKNPELDEQDLFRQLKYAERIKQLKKFIKHPFRAFHAKPVRALYFSIPASVIYLASTIHTLEHPCIECIDDTIVLAVFIILVPYTFFYEKRIRRMRSMEREMPEFLGRLASMNEAGLTLTKSIRASLESRLGVLDEDIRRIWKDIEWGAVTADALVRFETRVRTSMISRTITLIVKADEAVSDIRNVLWIAAGDAEAAYRLKQDRFSNMAVYVVVIYLSFFVFLFIVYVLSVYFIPMIPSGEDITKLSAGMTMLAQFDSKEYLLLMFHSTLIQGFCSGLVAGMMGEGNADAGLKHSLIMVAIAYIAFDYYVLV